MNFWYGVQFAVSAYLGRLLWLQANVFIGNEEVKFFTYVIISAIILMILDNIINSQRI